jgi:hypothetical protein
MPYPGDDHLRALANTESRYPDLLRGSGVGDTPLWRILLAAVLGIAIFAGILFGGGFILRVTSGVPEHLETANLDGAIWGDFITSTNGDPMFTTQSSTEFNLFDRYSFRTDDAGTVKFTDGKPFVQQLAKTHPDSIIYAASFNVPDGGDLVGNFLVFAVEVDGHFVYYKGNLIVPETAAGS